MAGSIWFRQPVNTVWAGINDNLVSYWKFDEGVADTCDGSKDVCDSQSSRHGELSGASGDLPQWSDTIKPTLATSNPYAMNFDGIDDEVNSLGDMDFPENNFSITTWVRPETWGDSADAYIHNLLCDESNGSDTTFCFRIGSKGDINLRQRFALMIETTTSNDFESTSNLTANTWNHITVTFDGSNVRFYLNGVLDRTQVANLTMKNGTVGFKIGASNTSDKRPYDGSIDELRVYDSVLTEDEVEELAGINPGVSTLSPADDVTNISKTSDLVITFNRDVQAVASKNITIKKTDDDSTVETIAADNTSLVTISGSTVTINPIATLEASTEYYVLIDSGALTDLSSNIYTGIADTTTWSFTTAANPSSSPTPSPSPSLSTNDSSSNNDSPKPDVCGDTVPIGKPDLFQIDVLGTEAKIYFTPLSSTNKYFISYSSKDNAEEHGLLVDLGNDGVQSYTVGYLNEGVTYYFKVRGQNGCMPGEWSNIRPSIHEKEKLVPENTVKAEEIEKEVVNQEKEKEEVKNQEQISEVEVEEKLKSSQLPYKSTGNVSSRIGNALGTMTQKTKKLSARVSSKIDQAGSNWVNSWKTVIEETGKSGQWVVHGSKKFISQQMFAAGQRTQYLSENIGYKLISLGYSFIDEPTQIYEVKVEILSPTEAMVSWLTNHPANGKVNYGLDPSYPKDIQSSELVTNHEFLLEDLTPETTYHFEVMSQAKSYVYDANRQFITTSN